jgi:hypothetical protein
MNKNFFEHAMKVLTSMSPDELERELIEFGFDYKRKVDLYSEAELFASFASSESQNADSVTLAFGIDDILPSLEFMAANDNSYALAA